MKVYVVTEFGYGYLQPIVTVFGNEEDAKKFASKTKTQQNMVIVDDCIIR